MLFTRCPDCDTTFRVTDEALKKANGHVRCGRCAGVFNAYSERQEPTAAAVVPEPASEQPRDPAPASAPGTIPETVAVATAPSEPEQEEHRDDRPTTDAAALQAAAPAERNATPATWARAEGQRSSHWWNIAAVLAVLTIGAQVLNHYRSELAGLPRLGPWVQRGYAQLGIEVSPRWDVRQYEILDWVATAEPNSAGVGSLKITARIRNRGPLRQPFPAVQLRLKDRWEETVGDRLFTPAEYLPRSVPLGRLMAPGDTTGAELELVDPGPDAYGFELDVCIETQPSQLTCGNDKVFL
jgi:predicted Zn finger-like uncharacterized protein